MHMHQYRIGSSLLNTHEFQKLLLWNSLKDCASQLLSNRTQTVNLAVKYY